MVGIVQNVYEAVDVLALIQDEAYDNLRLMVKDALFLRSDAVFSPLSLKLTIRNSRECLRAQLMIHLISYSKRSEERDCTDLSLSTIINDLWGCSR